MGIYSNEREIRKFKFCFTIKKGRKQEGLVISVSFRNGLHASALVFNLTSKGNSS